MHPTETAAAAAAAALVMASERVSSVLASFVCHHNVRAFIFDVMEMMDMPAGSLESILDRAGLDDKLEACVVQENSTALDVAQCALANGVAPVLAAGFTPELLHVQMEESIAQCKLNESGVAALRALQKAGYRVGLFGNVATPYKDRLLDLGVQDLCDFIGFSCEDVCTQPSLPFLRKFCLDMEVAVDQAMLVVGNAESLVDPFAPRALPWNTPIGAPMPPVTPKCEIVNSARAIAVGMHCAAMRASSIPEKIVSASGRAACVYLPDYTVAQFVGEVLGFPGPLDSGKLGFGPYSIPESQVFFATASSFAFVNIRPTTQGHCLVAPRRRVARFSDMGPDEVGDLWVTAQKISKLVQECFHTDAASLVLQDGASAGQSVPHVHIHVIPRFQRVPDSGGASGDAYAKVDLSDQRRPADGLDREVQPPGRLGAKGDAGSLASGPASLTLRTRTSFELTREANAFRQAIESRGGL